MRAYAMSLGLLLAAAAAPAGAAENACLGALKSYAADVVACTALLAQKPPVAAPTAAKALSRRGYAYFRTGDQARALHDFYEAIPLSPPRSADQARLYLAHGMIALRAQRNPEALTDLSMAYSLQPTSASALFGVGVAKVRVGDVAGGLADQKKAMGMEYGLDGQVGHDWWVAGGQRPDWAENCEGSYVHEWRRLAACTALIESGQETGAALAPTLVRRALALRTMGDYDAALGDLDRAIGLNPTDPYAFSRRADVLVRKGLVDRALADYARALKMDPENSGFKSARGEAYFAKGQYDLAIQDYDGSLAESADADVLILRGKAYAAKGAYDKAIDSYEKAQAESGSISNPRVGRGVAYYLKGDFPRALAAFEEVLAKEPGDMEGLFGRGLTRQKLGDLAGGNADLAKARTHNPEAAKVMWEDWRFRPSSAPKLP